MRTTFDRRGFLRLGVQSAASASLLATLGTMERVMAATDTSGYRALVCVFLYGGNDAFNWIVPRDNAGYGVYKASRRNLALDQASLLPITVAGPQQYGLHPSCPGIRDLFEAGRAAFVANVGTLIQPVTPAEFRSERVPLPPYLFSHSDQTIQWQTSQPQSRSGLGWAGRMSDLLKSSGYDPRLAMNVSLNGSNIWQSGATTIQYALGLDGAPELNATGNETYRGGTRRSAYLELLRQAGADAKLEANLLSHELARTQARAIDLAQFVNDGLATNTPLSTVFPSGSLGAQLRMAARMIQARNAINVSRQTFFIGLGGWDFHDRQFEDQAERLGDLSACLKAFDSAMLEIGASTQVTTFTATDFGRTLTTNGDGSDHGWGGHALVTGGAVRGKAIYGTMPDLTIGGPNDGGEGRIVPTLSTDQFAATLANWFGVSGSDLVDLFPNLVNFTTRNLGFMA